jgi:hypothetical protein
MSPLPWLEEGPRELDRSRGSEPRGATEPDAARWSISTPGGKASWWGAENAAAFMPCCIMPKKCCAAANAAAAAAGSPGAAGGAPGMPASPAGAACVARGACSVVGGANAPACGAAGFSAPADAVCSPAAGANAAPVPPAAGGAISVPRRCSLPTGGSQALNQIPTRDARLASQSDATTLRPPEERPRVDPSPRPPRDLRRRARASERGAGRCAPATRVASRQPPGSSHRQRHSTEGVIGACFSQI